jgi:hypothetical protein
MLVASLIGGVTRGLWLGVAIFLLLAVGMLTRNAFGHRVPIGRREIHLTPEAGQSNENGV